MSFIKDYRIKSLKNIPEPITHPEWEYEKYREAVKTLGYQSCLLHNAVVMIIPYLEDLAREGKVDASRVALIQQNLIEARGKPVS